MDIRDLTWDDWNESHIASHGVLRSEAEDVAFAKRSLGVRVGRRRYRLIGQTAEGRYLAIFVDSVGRGSFYVITARDATDAERRRLHSWHGR